MDTIGTLDKALEYLQDFLREQNARTDLELHQVRILLLLAKRFPDPVNYPDAGTVLGISPAAVGRNMKLLGQRMVKDRKGQWHDTGLGLVEVRPDPYETRRNISILTDKGKLLIENFRNLLDGGKKT